MRVLASGAMVALVLGLVAGWAEHPRAVAGKGMEGPRIIIDNSNGDGPGS